MLLAHTESQENSGIALSGRCFSFLLRNGNYLKSRSKRISSGGNVTHSTPWLLSCLRKGIGEVIFTCFWGCSALLHHQPGWRGYLLPLCFVVLGSFWEAQLRGQQFPCWKVTCKCLSASASGPIFFSFQCYWLSEEIRTKEYNILCVADRKFFRHAVLEILVGSKAFMVN